MDGRSPVSPGSTLNLRASGRILKTHAGVRAEFLRLIKDDGRLDADRRAFPSCSSNLKAIAGYETDPLPGVTATRAKDAIAT